jgi:hypothetical protein
MIGQSEQSTAETRDSNSGDAVAPLRGGRVLLRYWSVNVTLMHTIGWPMPGFAYDRNELRRMRAIADTVPRKAIVIWLLATALILVVLAGVTVAGTDVLVANFIVSDPARIPEPGVMAAFAMFLLLAIGVGLPLSIRWGGACADRLIAQPAWVEEPGDAALNAKARLQFLRFGAIVGVAVALVAIIANFI